MKALLLLADGFEDSEALTTRDILLRGGIEVVMASISSKKEVTSSYNLNVISDVLLTDIKIQDFDALILPGGGAGTKNLEASSLVQKTIKAFNSGHKLIAAICAAPGIVGRAGYLKDKKYTCYANCNQNVDGIFTKKSIEIDANFITARSMKYAIDFALEIIKNLLGIETCEKVKKQIEGL